MNIKSFEDVQEYLNGIPCINCGGCGISALVMFRWLKKNGQEVELVFLYDSYYEYCKDNNQRVMEKHEGEPDVPPHCCIRIKKRTYIDSEGSKRMVKRYNIRQIVPEWLLIDALRIHDWNHMFERTTYLMNKISEDLGIDLSDVPILE
jgi:hypothetical protein